MNSCPPPSVIVLHAVDLAESRLDEADTLIEVEAVASAIRRLGGTALTLAIKGDPEAVLRAAPRADVVFNLVETLEGQGCHAHVIPDVVAKVGLRCTGCSSLALRLTSHKTQAKELMQAAGIRTPRWSCDGAGFEPEAFVIVKPTWEDASFGIDAASVVAGRNAAAELSNRRSRYGGVWFAEEYIDGRELNVSVLQTPQGPQSLPVAEIRFVDFPPGRPRIVDFDAKWAVDTFVYQHTVRVFPRDLSDADLIEHLRAIALSCWNVFSLSGYARVEFRVDEEGRPWVLEVNGNPCLSPDAGFIAAAAEQNIGFDEVIDRIVATALASSDTDE